MVIVRLIGGLGNQLFQYAAGRRLALDRQVPLKLDTAALPKCDPPRAYGLGSFRINAQIATSAEKARFTGRSRSPVGRLAFRLTQCLLPYYKRSVVRERRRTGFDPRILKAPGDVVLIGFWQDKRYFAGAEAVIREEFAVKSESEGRNRELADEIAGVESVCVHVRRGDYASNPRLLRRLGLCGIDYYERCIERMVGHCREPHFFVFSDEPDWARENLPLRHPATFVDHNGPERDYEDLRLMGLCKHFIIANSTFSWWGAWLSRNPDKLVLAPRRWAVSEVIRRDGLIPETWQRV